MKTYRIARIAFPLLLLSLLFSITGRAQDTHKLFLPLIRIPMTLYLPLVRKPEPPPPPPPSNSHWMGPDGGTIVDLEVDPTDASIWYAATFGGGVFKSVDGGYTWASSSTGLTNMTIQSIAIDPENPAKLFAAAYKDKLYRSMDAGKTWSPSNTGLQPEVIVYDIEIDPVESHRIYLSTRGISNNGNPPWNGVIYRSTDGGDTWQEVLKDIGGTDQQDWAYTLDVDPDHHYMVYAAFHESGVLKSQNYGETWVGSGEGLTDNSGRIIGVDPFASNRLFFGVWHGSGLFYSKDYATNWTAIEDGTLGAKIKMLAFNPITNGLMYLGTFGDGFMLSNDNGMTWDSTGLTPYGIYSLLPDPENKLRVFVGTSEGGLWVTSDGGVSFGGSQSGLHASNVTSLAISADTGTFYASSLGGGVDLSTNSGDTWQYFSGGLPDAWVNQVLVDPVDPSALLALTQYMGLYRYDPALQEWAPYGSGLPEPEALAPLYGPDHPLASYEVREGDLESWQALEAVRIPQVTKSYSPQYALVTAPANPAIAYMGTSAGVYKTSDGGATWAPNGLAGVPVDHLVMPPGSSTAVFASAPNFARVYNTYDGGANWQTDVIPGNSVEALAWVGGATGKVFAGTDIGLYRREASGVWSQVGFSGLHVTAIGASPDDPNHLFVSTSGGTYESENGGATWTRTAYELDRFVVRSILFDPRPENEAVFFLTSSYGIFWKTY